MSMVAANMVVVPIQLPPLVAAQAMLTMEHPHQLVVQHLLARLLHPQTISQFQRHNLQEVKLLRLSTVHHDLVPSAPAFG